MLCERSENGRVLVQKGDDMSGNLKYLLLNPAEHFVEVVKQCRSVSIEPWSFSKLYEYNCY